MVTITGNLMVMVSFKLDKQLQTISNYFLFSLAVADMIIGKDYFYHLSFFVFFDFRFSKQNVKSLLTPASDTIFHALSHGSQHFVLHGSLIHQSPPISKILILLKNFNQSENC